VCGRSVILSIAAAPMLTPLDQEAATALARGRSHVRRARLVAALVLLTVVGHLIYLMWPCWAELTPLRRILVSAYLILMATGLIWPLFSRSRTIFEERLGEERQDPRGP
jgi:hypothetical protein